MTILLVRPSELLCTTKFPRVNDPSARLWARASPSTATNIPSANDDGRPRTDHGNQFIPAVGTLSAESKSVSATNFRAETRNNNGHG